MNLTADTVIEVRRWAVEQVLRRHEPGLDGMDAAAVIKAAAAFASFVLHADALPREGEGVGDPVSVGLNGAVRRDLALTGGEVEHDRQQNSLFAVSAEIGAVGQGHSESSFGRVEAPMVDGAGRDSNVPAPSVTSASDPEAAGA